MLNCLSNRFAGSIGLPFSMLTLSRFFLIALILSALSLTKAEAQEKLLFCNTPEQLRMTGNCATARLVPNKTYTIFYHYRNATRSSGIFAIKVKGSGHTPLHVTIRKGIAEPQRSPAWAGRQAMARFLGAGSNEYRSNNRVVGLGYRIAPRQVASGVMTITCNQRARIDLYFGHNRYPVNGSRMLAVESPHRSVTVNLSSHVRRKSVRIGESDRSMSRYLDGAYGLVYAIRVHAPNGRRVRVSFSPRGGRSGMVCSINGSLCQSDIIQATRWRVLGEKTVGKKGLTLTTAPFGGVFYPVELVFQLI